MDPLSQEEPQEKDHLLFAMIVAILGCIALGLILVWLNIERTKLKYNIRDLRANASICSDRHSKLLVERENLLSPQSLGAAAANLGLLTAKPGQVRRMGTVTSITNATESDESK